MEGGHRKRFSLHPSIVAAIGLLILLVSQPGCGSAREAAHSLGFRDHAGLQDSPLSGHQGERPVIRRVNALADSNKSAENRSQVRLVSAERDAPEKAGSEIESRVQKASAITPLAQLPQDAPQTLPGDANQVEQPDVPLLPAERPRERYPLNLGTALQLAGANNLQIALATERVREALARLDGAEVLWVPSLNAGVGYNNHAGQLQATEGDVIEVNRDSVFVGGGPVLSGAPLTGAAGGPARFFVDISPADIYFAPLAARQAAASAQADESAVFNDTLLLVAVTYLQLVQAQNEVAIAEEAVTSAKELLRITDRFAETGAGLPADAERARAELARRRREFLNAEEQLRVVSAELARQLRLPPETLLYAVDAQPVPLKLISEERPLDELIALGMSGRPELAREQALIGQTLERWRQERWRPWLPNLHLGLSSGGFGGGGDGFFGDFSDRTDFDALAVWELQNLGLGNRALQRERASQHRQAHLSYQQTSDRVAAEIMQAYQQVQYRRRQIEEAETQVKAAASALPLNFAGIRGLELRAIEAQQAIGALADARSRYVAAVIRYNQAQFALLRALGIPPQTAEEGSD